MKAYSKPIAELENFRLDSEFASGACSVIPDDVKEKYHGTFAGYMDAAMEELEAYQGGVPLNALELLIQIADYNGDVTLEQLVGMSASDSLFQSAVDNFTMGQITGSQDNPTSGFCYMTFGAGDGKNFS